MKRITCGELAVDPDKLAPVSGCRCRSCGANARNRPADERWTIARSAAWCPDAECQNEAGWAGHESGIE